MVLTFRDSGSIPVEVVVTNINFTFVLVKYPYLID